MLPCDASSYGIGAVLRNVDPIVNSNLCTLLLAASPSPRKTKRRSRHHLWCAKYSANTYWVVHSHYLPIINRCLSCLENNPLYPSLLQQELSNRRSYCQHTVTSLYTPLRRRVHVPTIYHELRYKMPTSHQTRKRYKYHFL